MNQEDGTLSVKPGSSPTVIHPVVRTQASPAGEVEDVPHTMPFFPVTEQVTYRSMTTAPKREAWHLPSGMARLVTVVTLSAALALPLAACTSSADCYESDTIDQSNVTYINGTPYVNDKNTGTSKPVSGVGSSKSNCNHSGGYYGG